jgi:Haem-binding domain
MDGKGDEVKRFLRTFLISAAGAWVFASAVIHPFGAVKSANSSSNALLSGTPISGEPLRVFERSCQNCHSDKTSWPWYSYVAPMSLMIESDVSEARGRMNLSHWNEYSIDDQQSLLASIAAAVRSRQMPPSRYVLLHPDAKLSPEERELIYNWARGERRRLRALDVTQPSAGF